MPTTQTLLLSVERSYASFSSNVDTYQRLVGEVQSRNHEGVMFSLNILHNTTKLLKHDGNSLHQVIDGFLSKVEARERSVQRRLRILEQNLENTRRRFEQSQQTLEHFTHLMSEGLN